MIGTPRPSKQETTEAFNLKPSTKSSLLLLLVRHEGFAYMAEFEEIACARSGGLAVSTRLLLVLCCCWYSFVVGDGIRWLHTPEPTAELDFALKKTNCRFSFGPIGPRIPARRSFSPHILVTVQRVYTIPMRLYDKASLILLANGKRALDKQLPRTHLPRHGASTNYRGLLHGPRSGANGFARPSRPILQTAGAKAPSGSESQVRCY